MTILFWLLLQAAAPSPYPVIEHLLNEESSATCGATERICFLGRQSLVNSVGHELLNRPECKEAGDGPITCSGAIADLVARSRARFDAIKADARELNPLTLNPGGPTAPDQAALDPAAEAAIAGLDGPCSASHMVCTAGRLALLVDVDQSIRWALAGCASLGDRRAQCESWAGSRLDWIDALSSKWMERLLEREGWPGRTRYGATASNNAWLLVQHADKRQALQQKALPMLRAAVATGEAAGPDLALLEDRVAGHENRLQRYGTQGSCDGAMWKPFPVEEPAAELDARRASVGLPDEATYAATVARLFCRPAAPAGARPDK
jgi:hypothetical protein